ncbi:MAG TPA: DUF2214 family protein, partial [Rhizomicrobium sp.]
MTEAIVVAWLHYMGIMAFLACVLGEHLLLKPQVTLTEAKTLQRLDILYGVSAVVVLLTGIRRMQLEKGFDYYNHHIGFQILVTLFVIIGLLSIYPTMVFFRWRKDTRAGRAPVMATSQFKNIQKILRLEMFLLLLAP